MGGFWLFFLCVAFLWEGGEWKQCIVCAVEGLEIHSRLHLVSKCPGSGLISTTGYEEFWHVFGRLALLLLCCVMWQVNWNKTFFLKKIKASSFIFRHALNKRWSLCKNRDTFKGKKTNSFPSRALLQNLISQQTVEPRYCKVQSVFDVHYRSSLHNSSIR